MDEIKYVVFNDKKIWLFGKNQYISTVESGSNKIEIKY